MEDHLSMDPVRRQPHLDKIFDEMLNVKFNKTMFEKEYLAEHIDEVKLLVDKTTYIENIIKENRKGIYT